MASNLRVVPGAPPQPERRPGQPRAARRPPPPGTAPGPRSPRSIAARDEIYASGYPHEPAPGSPRAWTFTFELDEAPAAPIRLHLDGWVFPSDASLNLAVAQRADLPVSRTASRGRDRGGLGGCWSPISACRPARPRPWSSTRRRCRPERAACASSPHSGSPGTGSPGRRSSADAEATTVAMLAPALAELRYRGFSAALPARPQRAARLRLRRRRRDLALAAVSGPLHAVTATSASCWRRPTIAARILAPGDELALEFDGSAPAAAGARLPAHALAREPRLGQGLSTATPSPANASSRSRSAP